LTEKESYSLAWRDRARRGLLTVIILFGGFIVLVAPMLAFNTEHRERYAFLFVIGLVVWLVALLSAGFYHTRFRCPRCGEFFNSKRWTTPFCVHCGLPSGSPPTSEIAPAFSEWRRRKSN
jgi:hypothetical protein